MSRLTWDDLLLHAPVQDDYAKWLSPWGGLIEGVVGPLFLNRFGCWFLRRPDGSTDFFDVLTGGLETVAQTPEEFAACMNHQPWQEAYLLTEVIYQLRQMGAVAEGTKCLSLVPHPKLGGKNPFANQVVDVTDVMLMEVGLWQGICRDSLFRADRLLFSPARVCRGGLTRR